MPLAGSFLTNRSRVWPVNFFHHNNSVRVTSSKLESLKVLSSSGKEGTKFIFVYNFTVHLNFGVIAVRDTKLRSSVSKNIHLSRNS